MDGSWALAIALGHVRNAAAGFVAAEDPTGESLFLAAECLDLEGLYSEFGVVPEVVARDIGASESLDLAAEVLASVRPNVPLAVWAGMQALRRRAARACAVNWRFTLSSGVGAPAGIVVRGALALLTPRSPLIRISRSTVHRATSVCPCRRSSCQTFRTPYTP